MGVGVEVKGAWRINTFLFLLTGSQAVLLPWSPVILKAAGLSAALVGLVMSLITIMGSFGVMGCLVGMRRTHSGAARRLLLFFLTTTSSVFYITAILLLPTSIAGNTCDSSFNEPVGTSNHYVDVSPNETAAVSNTSSLQHINPSISSVVTQHPSDPGNNIQNPYSYASFNVTEAIFNTSQNTEVKPNTTVVEGQMGYSQSTKGEDAMTNATTTSAAETIEKTTTPGVLPGEGKIENLEQNQTESYMPNYNELSLNQTAHSQDEAASATSSQSVTTTHYSGGNKTNSQSFNVTVPLQTSPSYSKPAVSSSKPNSKFSQKFNPSKTSTTATTSTTSGNPQSSSQMSNNSFKGTPSGDNSSYKGHSTMKNSNSHPKVSTTLKDHHTSPSHGRSSFSNAEEIDASDGFSPDSIDSYYDYSEDSRAFPSYDDDDDDGDNDKLAGDLPFSRNVASQYRPHVKSHLVPPLPPPPPPPPPHHKSYLNDGTLNFKAILKPNRYNDPSQRFQLPQERSSAFQNSNGNIDRNPIFETNTQELEDKEALAHHLPGSQLSPSHHRTHGQNKHYSGREEFQSLKSRSSRTHGRSGHYDQFSTRYKRSVPRKDHQSSNPKVLQPTELKGSTISEDAKGTNNSEVNTPNVRHMNIRSIMDSINSPLGIQVGVSLLLIFGSLLGTGVEVGVAKLWHCYAHGYEEGGVNQDILQRTISHTFQLSIYAAHKSWSGISSGAWVVGGGIIASLVCWMGVETGVYGMLGSVHLALAVFATLTLLVIPVPYGSVDPPKTRRPLSLYLDDEVLREGVRRLAFHIWVLVNGCVAALPMVFRMWVVMELTVTQGAALAAQTGAVAVTLASESLVLQGQRWLMARIGLQGMMGVGGLAMMLHLMLMWVSENLGVIVVCHAGLGCSSALLWVCVRHNALLLATVKDQEREAWASWWCWRVGVCVGSIVWGSGVDVQRSISHLFKLDAFISASIALTVATAAVVTSRRQGRTRRRVYHTLDLDMDDQGDDDEDDEANEDDWLVKRAKKEGIDL